MLKLRNADYSKMRTSLSPLQQPLRTSGTLCHRWCHFLKQCWSPFLWLSFQDVTKIHQCQCQRRERQLLKPRHRVLTCLAPRTWHQATSGFSPVRMTRKSECLKLILDTEEATRAQLQTRGKQTTELLLGGQGPRRNAFKVRRWCEGLMPISVLRQSLAV